MKCNHKNTEIVNSEDKIKKEINVIEEVIEELKTEHRRNFDFYTKGYNDDSGIRSSQVRALIGLLVKKGILK